MTMRAPWTTKRDETHEATSEDILGWMDAAGTFEWWCQRLLDENDAAGLSGCAELLEETFFCVVQLRVANRVMNEIFEN